MPSDTSTGLIEPHHLRAIVGGVVFARHGRTKHNLDGIIQGSRDTLPLSDEGREDARVLAAELAGENVRTILTSPLRRARETAEIVAKEHGLPDPVVIGELRECDYGSWEGRPKKVLVADAKRTEWFKRPVSAGLRGIPDDGEPYLELLQRTNGVLRRLADELPPEGSAVVIAHAGVLRAIRFLKILSEAGVRELRAETVIPHEDKVFHEDVRHVRHAVFRLE